MRPIELTIEGLRSFRQPVTIGFADRELVAIIGDTGAGKSSILEALTWALYGNATWTKHAGVLVGDGCPQMRVRLTFQADGNTWQVTRALRRQQDGTPGPTKAELVCTDGDRAAADGVRQVNEAIQQLLGLDWDAFTRTVVLPQGQFARLLTEGDVDRMRILAQIWRTDELAQARNQADGTLRELEAHLEYLRGRRQGFPTDIAAELRAAAQQAAEAQKAADTAAEAARAATECEKAVEQATNRARAIREVVTEVEKTLAPDLTENARALAATAADLDKQLADLEQAIAKQQETIDQLARPVDDGGPDRETTQLAATTLSQLAQSLGDLAEHLERINRLRADAQTQHAETGRLREQAEAADNQVRDAEHDLARWQRTDAAATAANGLHHGDDCPVCARPLPDDWQPPDASGLQQATESLTRARAAAKTAHDNASGKAAEAKATRQRVDQETADLTRRLERISDAVAGLPEPFRPQLPEPFTAEHLEPDQLTDALLEDPTAAAQQRLQQFADHDNRLRAANEKLQQLRTEHTDTRERRHTDVTVPATELRSRLHQLATCVQACVRAGIELPSAVPEIREPLEHLPDDARAIADIAVSALEAARTSINDAEQEREEHEQKLKKFLTDAGVESLDALVDVRARRQAEASRARTQQQQLERIKPVVEALDNHIEQGAQLVGGLTDLKTLLQDGRFIRWLTIRRSRTLLAVASTLLEEMTGGRYAFADITDEHDEWRVFDTETGYARSPRTLSGGESFVASLALALGMVEMVARTGGRLDALFLDEGFGALDRENLDAAIDALESSATRGRMVAVISHVQAVAERLTDVLAVDRTPTGSQAQWLTATEREGIAAAEATSSVRNLLD